MKVILKTIVIVLLATSIGQAQTKLKQTTGSKIQVDGTSSMHDWTMNGSNPSCEATFILDENGGITSVNALRFSMQVKALKSSKSGLDKNAYSTLKADKFDKITYTMISATPVQANGNSFVIKTTGNLVVAGVTKKTDLQTTCTKNSNGTYTCTGTKDLKMTDFNLEPPSFMFGAMKTGDELIIKYEIILSK